MWTQKTKTMCITPQEVNNKIHQDLKKKWVNDFTELGKRRKDAIWMWAKKYKQGRFGLGWSNDNGSSEEAIQEKINTKKGKQWRLERAEEKLRDGSGRCGDRGAVCYPNRPVSGVGLHDHRWWRRQQIQGTPSGSCAKKVQTNQKQHFPT